MTRWSLFSTISKNVASSWEDRVRKMESRQQNTFDELLANQLQQTLEEETRQSQQERIRDAEFDASMMALHETFLQKESSRAKVYQNTQLEQRELARESEDSRDVRFKLANDKRDVLFHRDCEARQKRSELYTDIRDRHIRQRHDSREAAFQKLEALLQDQIDTTWRILELVSPPQIDEETQEMNTKRYSPLVNTKQKSSTAKAVQRGRSRSHPRGRFPSRGRQGTPSYIPVFVIRESRSPGVPPSSGVSYISPDSQQGSVDYATRRWLNPQLPEVSQVDIGQLPAIEPTSPDVSVMDLPLPPVEVPTTNNYLCARNSERRAIQDNLFWEQEEKAEFRFEAAEAQRDAAEATRFRAHDAEERRREHEFMRVMEANEVQFSQQEVARDGIGILRAKQFENDQNYRFQLFKQTLKWERQKHIAAQNSEDEWIKSATARIEALSNVHKHLVEEVRRHQVTIEDSETMSDQQTKLFDWSCVTMVEPDQAPVETISLWETPSSKSSLSISRKGHGIRKDRRYNPSSVRRPTPEVFKNRRTRHQGGLPPPIPIFGPRFVEHMPTSRLSNEQVVPRPKPQRSFKKAQVERQKTFVHNTKKRRAIFEAKEQERARQFFEGQRARSCRSGQAEDDRQNLFNQSQLHRRERFQEGQERREINFREAEHHWQQEFLTEQGSRERRFNSCLERLRRECFILENQRTLKFDMWCRERLRCVMLRSRSWTVKNHGQG